MENQEILWGNPVHSWLVALFILLGTTLLLAFLRSFCLKRLERNAKDSPFFWLLRSTHWTAYLAFWLWLGSGFIQLPPKVSPYLRLIVILFLGIQATRWVSALLEGYFTKHDKDLPGDEQGQRISHRVIATLVKVIVWIIVALLALENIPDLQVSSLITGLGIGGIAVSLAAQKVIADLLSSITIRLDKPFVVGDSIRVSGFVGKVSSIGLRSTRIQNLSGEELIFSNSDLLSTPIQNFNRMPERRIQVSIPLDYSNSPASLEKLPDLVRQAVESTPNTRFHSFYLIELADLRMRYHLVYYITTGDWETAQIAQNAVNHALLACFASEGIRLTSNPAADQAVYLSQSEP